MKLVGILAGFVCVMPAASMAALEDGLLAYYAFEDSLDLAADTADIVLGNGPGAGSNDGIVVGSPTSVAGKVGNAVSFSGAANEYIRVDTLTVQSTFSIHAWVKPNNTDGDQNAIQFGGNYGLYELRNGGPITNVMNQGSWNFYDYSSTYQNDTFSDGFWHQIAMTYDGSFVSIYVDGVLDGQFAQTGVPTAQGAQWLGIGTNGGWADSPFDGAIDEVGFWERALDQVEILDLYAGGVGIPVPEPGTGVLLGFGLIFLARQRRS